MRHGSRVYPNGTRPIASLIAPRRSLDLKRPRSLSCPLPTTTTLALALDSRLSPTTSIHRTPFVACQPHPPSALCPPFHVTVALLAVAVCPPPDRRIHPIAAQAPLLSAPANVHTLDFCRALDRLQALSARALRLTSASGNCRLQQIGASVDVLRLSDTTRYAPRDL